MKRRKTPKTESVSVTAKPEAPGCNAGMYHHRLSSIRPDRRVRSPSRRMLHKCG